MGFRDRVLSAISHGWDAFNNTREIFDSGPGYSSRPDRPRIRSGSDKTIVSSIYTRLAVDASSVAFRHVRLDEMGRYFEDIDSGLNNCLTVEANIDQTGVHLLRDTFFTMFDKGVCAIVPVRTSLDPTYSTGWNILDMRVGEIVQFYPKKVKVRLYNDDAGKYQDVVLDKKQVAVVENPFYSVMNEPNSTLQRLTRKISLLDTVDEAAGSGKLDMIIQFPHTIKSEARRQQAEQRRSEIEFQMKGAQYGIAYIDGTEKITQLNRPSENNLLAQIEYLTAQVYTQLGLTPDIMNGTADKDVMLNYMNRTISPFLDAVRDSMHRTFLSKTARTQRQAVRYFINVFKLIPLTELAELGDKFTRNEIMTANELRQVLGLAPSGDKKADMLRNSNMPEKDLGRDAPAQEEEVTV